MAMLDREALLKAMRTAVEKRGADYVDPFAEHDACKYVISRDSDQPLPGCIIGTAVYEGLGVFVEEGVEGMNAEHLTEYLTEDAMGVACAAQSVQDVGGTWGEALEAAEEYI